MEPLQPAAIGNATGRKPGSERRLAVWASMTFVMLAGLSGCVPEAFLIQPGASTEPPALLATRWDHDIHFPNDTESGKTLPTIAGRITMFASDLKTPVLAEGSIYVYMYSDMPEAKDKEELIAFWGFDTKTARKLRTKDAVGWGYTLPLPWSTYSPDLTQVRLKVRFDRVGGSSALYSSTIPVSFEHDTGKPKMVFSSKRMTASQMASAMPPPSGAEDVGHGSLPTTVTLSPPPAKTSTWGNDAPFVAPQTTRPATSTNQAAFVAPRSTSSLPPSSSDNDAPFVVPPPGAVRQQ
jgi:hypothetical protein